MTATEALERRIDELCEENERLRQERDEWRRVAVSKQDIIDHMRDARAENAKLRELVRYAYECAIHSDHATCDDCRRMNGYCILEQRMRELGVDDG